MTRRDMQAQIDSSFSIDSLFHASQGAGTTDTTVYPEPTQYVEIKKRKLDDSSSAGAIPVNSVVYARLPSQMLANQHLIKIHGVIKTECEDLVQLIV